jgi:cytochrome c55X
MLNGLLGWMAGTAVVFALFSAASLAALTALAAVSPTALDPTSTPAAPSAVAPDRAVVLRHLLIQDCGSCHGLTLGGGLGPPLQRQTLTDKPVPYLAAVILHGRPGTAMPPWSALLSATEGEWLARELKGENP